MKTQTKKILTLGLLGGFAAFLAADTAVGQTLVTKDKVANRVGVFRGGSTFTLGGGGHTGAAADRAVEFGMGTGPVYIQNGSFLNTLAQADEMTVAFWAKKYDITDNSAFWFNSPLSSSGFRGMQAHLPWSNNRIYFDHAGCCNPPQRIDQDIFMMPGYTDVTWWNTWHFFVFTKKAGNKEIWIDGQFFWDQLNAHPGENAAPLPTDFTEIYLGSEGNGTANLFHGQLDDFCVFGTALSSTTISQLFAGTLPGALPASDKLTAWWDFNDFPAEGAFLSIKPAANSFAGAPNLIEIVHTDGDVPWTLANLTLKVDGATVTPTLVRDGIKATVSYVPSPVFAAQTLHKVSLTYPSGVGTTATINWEFVVAPYTQDVIASRLGSFLGGSTFTAAGGGKSGAPGDRAADFGNGTGPVYVSDASFLNTLTAADELSFGFWLKKPFVDSGCAFWANSPSSSGTQRGYSAHVPWGDNNIYFDSAGCCNPDETRIYANISTFIGYTGDPGWWTNWHYVVFQKKQAVKEIWIDGQLFLTGGGLPLPTDYNELFIGASSPAAAMVMCGQIDDFAVFGTALAETSISQLYGGVAPTSLPSTDKLTAYWNFNDFPAQGLITSILPTPYSTNARPDLVQVIHLDGATPWVASSASLKVDDVPVVSTFTKVGPKATITYQPNPMFPPGSAHKATLTYPGASGSPETLEWVFTVGAWPMVISEDLWTPPGSGDNTKPGFKARIWQIDQLGTVGLVNYAYRAEQELAGIIGPNVADLSLATDGLFTMDLVNWNQNAALGSIGNFTPDDPIPGIPGTIATAYPTDNIAAELITYIEFPAAGYYTMGVNSDDGFRVTVTDTPPANNLALVVTSPPAAAGKYYAVPAPAGTAKPITTPITGKLVYMDPPDGCTPAVNAGALLGNVALIDRGNCEFSAKLLNARNAGAIAAVIVNNRTPDLGTWAEGIFPIDMGIGAAGYQDIPAVMITFPDGDKIKTELANNVFISLAKDMTPIVGEFDAGRGSSDSIFNFIVKTPGVYPFRCVWFEGGGDANLEWFMVTPLGDKLQLNDRSKAEGLKSYRARTVAPKPKIDIVLDSGNLVITFTGKLVVGNSVTGPWTELTVSSPYTIPATGDPKFYRAKF